MNDRDAKKTTKKYESLEFHQHKHLFQYDQLILTCQE